MPFERFKAKHGGMGPLQAFYAGATDGQGLVGQWRPTFARERIGAAVDAIREDADLPEDFKELAETARNANLSVPETFAAINQLQQRARDIKAVNGAFRGFGEQQTRLRNQAITTEDRAQLDVFDTQAEFARRLLLSSNPELQAMGRDTIGRVFAGQQQFATTNEAQQIAAEASLGSERWTRFTSAYDDLYRESTPFLEIQRSYGALRAAYQGEGTPGNTADLAAINSLQRMIDPGATVRDGDVSLLQNLAGVPEFVVTAFNRVAKEGGRFTPQERAEVVALGNRLMTAANARQAETNVRFQDLGAAGELPQSFVDKLKIPLTDTGEGTGALNFGTQQDGPAPLEVGDVVDTPPAGPPGTLERNWPAVDQFVRRAVNLFPRAPQRATDEYEPEPPPPREPGFSPDGTRNGVYVPRRLRPLFNRRRGQ